MKTFFYSLVLLIGALSFNAVAQTSPPLKIGANTFVGYGLLYLAQEKGFFKQQGVDVQIVNTEDKPSTAAALASGRLDGWVTTVDTFIFYDAKKLGIKQVLAISLSAGAEGILATGDITSVAQLKGKRIAVEEGSPAYFFLLNVLADNHLTQDDVKIVNMKGSDAGAAFVAGKIDVAGTWDPWLGQAGKRNGGHILIDTRQKPGLIADTLALRNEVITNRPQDIEGLIKAYFASYDYWYAHQDEANQIIAKASGIPLKDVQEGLKSVKFGSKQENIDYLLKADGITRVIEHGVAVYGAAGLLKQQPKAEDIVDLSLLQSVVKP
ncbi:ABC transporter substrate-binding protein [Sodalis sp. RH21]|uniref:ABC transporter substrate-binding protein n=1 Tax=unclassified Sodalis (in: enterobacteria) TaxID=2636512 RepID=UPI0039B61091